MYIIQEMQTTNGTTVFLPAITKEDKNEMESVFYTIRGAAAISNVEIHAVTVFDEHGNPVMHAFYEHFPEEA